ncbi:hypothetical protein J3R30DRAFT_20414 [Lentinula aciculospora]|uniref:Uncharacterized protein n=1 Tax=Lentinula aciculospora TaxID=153920 RepID=A0A9W9DX35_9AGAR|nr:hypothetical protein J3R30DRAFT_20414 [Lentinula aciculospora]
MSTFAFVAVAMLTLVQAAVLPTSHNATGGTFVVNALLPWRIRQDTTSAMSTYDNQIQAPLSKECLIFVPTDSPFRVVCQNSWWQTNLSNPKIRSEKFRYTILNSSFGFSWVSNCSLGIIFKVCALT